MAGRVNHPPELIQLVDIWGTTPTCWRVCRSDRFSDDADDGAYLVPLWGEDDFGMQCIVHMVLIWTTATLGPACPPYVYVCMCRYTYLCIYIYICIYRCATS